MSIFTPKPRSRILYACLIVCTISAGLASRAKSLQPFLPEFISEYAGDTLYALLSFFGFAFLWRSAATIKITGAALLYCFLIELSQLYHAPWIDAIRHTRLGGLILGFGFLWSDLLCYFAGVLLGIIIEVVLGIGSKRLRENDRN